MICLTQRLLSDSGPYRAIGKPPLAIACLCFLTLTAVTADAAPPAMAAADGGVPGAVGQQDDALIRNLFTQVIGNAAVKVSVTPLFGGHFAVTVSGELTTAKDVTDVTTAANKAKAQINSDKAGTIRDGDLSVKGLAVAKPQDDVGKAVDSIAKKLALYVADDRVKITVQPKPANTFLVTAAGALPSVAARDEVEKTIQAAIAELSPTPKREAATMTHESAEAPTGSAGPSTAPTVVRLAANPYERLYVDARVGIGDYFSHHLNDPRLTVEVQQVSGGSGPAQYRVAVAGTLDSQGQRESVLNQTAEDLTEYNAKDAAGLQLPPVLSLDTARLTVTDRSVTAVWPISFLGGAGTADDTKLTAVDSLVDAFNATYPVPDGKPVIRDSNNLYLHGKATDVLKMKAALALIDTSQPQVQLDIWAVQVSGSQQQVAQRAAEIRKHYADAQGLLAVVSPTLKLALQKSADAPGMSLNLQLQERRSVLAGIYGKLYPSEYRQILRGQPDAFGRSFTVDEALILMGVSDFRGSVLRQFQQEWLHSPVLADYLKNLRKDHDDAYNKGKMDEADAIDKQCQALSDPYPFRHLAETLNGSYLRADQNGIRDFLDSVNNYGALVRAIGADGEPQGSSFSDSGDKTLDPYDTMLRTQFAAEDLGRHSSVVDGMLEHIIAAFQADLQGMILSPLIVRVRSSYPETARDGGVSLVGKTRIVVTSRQRALLQPTLVSSVETTRPAPFEQDLLNLIAPAGAGGTKVTKTATDKDGTKSTEETTTSTHDDTGLSGAAKLLAGLPQGQAALLAGALLSAVPPTFNSVAPGVSISVHPNMSPDGTSADLYLDSSFGVTTTALGTDKSRTDVWAQAEPDAVQSHHVTTHAYVSGFDLFDVSSFDIETATPQGPNSIPIISRLPLIGQMFQFPRGSRRVQHESIVLVNATLLPTALGMVNAYGASRSGQLSPPPGSHADKTIIQKTRQYEIGRTALY